MTERVTTADVRRLLRGRHDPQAWAYFEEVPNGTGSNKTRSADAIAMSLWPSRGLELHGYEIKSSRSDWVRELKEPAKAEAFYGWCHYWWLVVSDDTIVKEGELPSTWGLLSVKNGKMRVVKDAPLNEHLKPLNYSILAGILRVLVRTTTPTSAIQERIDTAHTQGVEAGKRSIKYESDGALRRVKELEQTIKDFEERSGVVIDRWNTGRIGEAVKMVMQCGAENARTELTGMLRRVNNLSKQLQIALDGDGPPV